MFSIVSLCQENKTSYQQVKIYLNFYSVTQYKIKVNDVESRGRSVKKIIQVLTESPIEMSALTATRFVMPQTDLEIN